MSNHLADDSRLKLPQPVSNHSSGQRAPSFFDSDQTPPVVVVWMNSDLHTPLLSEGQLKQLMQSMPNRDFRPQQAESIAWQPDSRSSVRSASFTQPLPGEPLGLTSVPQQITNFNDRLKALRARYETKTKQVATDDSADSILKSEMNSLLGLAGDWIERAASELKKFEKDTAKESAFNDDLKSQEIELAKEKKLASSNLTTKLDLLSNVRSEAIEKLQKDLKEQEAKLAASMEKQREVRKEISNRDQRVTELPSLMRKNAKEEDRIKQELEELKRQPDDLNRSLQELWLDAKFLSLEIIEKSLDLESNRNQQFARILPLQLEELALRIRRFNSRLEELRGRSDELRDQQIDERRLAARRALDKKLTQSTPQLKELAEFNVDLVVQKKTMAKKGDELEKELISVKRMQDELAKSQEQIEDQIEKLGPTASGIRLVEHRRSLISTGKSQHRLLELKEQLQYKQTRKLIVQERRDRLVLGDFFKLKVLANVEEQVQDLVQRQLAVDVANELMETEKEYATDLLIMFEDNIDKLSQLEAAHKTLIDEVNKARAFSDKNALWIRSAKPFEINDLKICQDGLQSVIKSDEWRGLRDHTYQTFRQRPYDAGLLALVIGSLLVVRRRLRWSHE